MGVTRTGLGSKVGAGVIGSCVGSGLLYSSSLSTVIVAVLSSEGSVVAYVVFEVVTLESFPEAFRVCFFAHFDPFIYCNCFCFVCGWSLA